MVEPHYHQNAAELVYCISGSAVVSLINPFTNELLHFPITPGQVANVPQGWWHYEVASVDDTHIIAIFDAPTPEVILGSDILKITPPDILAHTYCLDETKVRDTLAPVEKRTFIGPPKDCNKGQVEGASNKSFPNQQYPNANYPNSNHPYTQRVFAPQGYPQQAYPQQAYINQVQNTLPNQQQNPQQTYRYPYNY